MATSPINSTSSSSYTGSTAPVLPEKTLGQQDFLKLLVAQMTSQDPMNPQSNTDFAAQMAQFSALQTSQNTAAQIADMRTDQLVADANNLIGRTVTVLDAKGQPATGTVASVNIADGVPKIIMNGSSYALSQIVTIQPTVVTAAQ